MDSSYYIVTTSYDVSTDNSDISRLPLIFEVSFETGDLEFQDNFENVSLYFMHGDIYSSFRSSSTL